jgi:hypothetical protein
MIKRPYSWIAVAGVCPLVLLGVTLLRPGGAQAQGQYPMVDKMAAQIVQKYQTASCEQLWMKKEQHAPPSMEEQRAIGILRNDPQMRAEFINKIAAPIANKMFECGMIP